MDRNSCWFALHVNVRRENVVTSALRSQGFEALLPLHRTRRCWSDRIKELEVPLFPRYVFCRFNVEKRLRVLTTTGVEYVVGLGKIPVPVPEVEIAALQEVMKLGAAAEPWPFLQTGQWVRMEAGPLAGLEGILVALRGRRRLVISVTLLQRSVAVEIDRLDATPIGPPRRSCSTVSLPPARPEFRPESALCLY